MPTCNECLTPCNCLVSEDGFRAGRGDPDGRRNTVVSGNGTIENPYTVSFQMSGEYRPGAGEIQHGAEATQNNFPENVSFVDGVTIWESPDTNIFYFGPTLATVTVGNFHVAGASCRFDAVNTTGVRRINLVGLDQDGDSHYIACDVQHGNASRQTVLSCSAFSAGVLTPDPGILPIFSNTKINGWIVAIYQTSGGVLSVSEVKLWIGTL